MKIKIYVLKLYFWYLKILNRIISERMDLVLRSCGIRSYGPFISNQYPQIPGYTDIHSRIESTGQEMNRLYDVLYLLCDSYLQSKNDNYQTCISNLQSMWCNLQAQFIDDLKTQEWMIMDYLNPNWEKAHNKSKSVPPLVCGESEE